jgi:hypothetical protein
MAWTLQNLEESKNKQYMLCRMPKIGAFTVVNRPQHIGMALIATNHVKSSTQQKAAAMIATNESALSCVFLFE